MCVCVCAFKMRTARTNRERREEEKNTNSTNYNAILNAREVQWEVASTTDARWKKKNRSDRDLCARVERFSS